jgi:hypothetical protein
MPEDVQLDVEQTFEAQKDKVVKTIIPTLMKTIDLVTYPIGEGVIYEMMHKRHRHQRENARNKKKSQVERKKEAGRKHSNSRRLEVNKSSTLFSLIIYVLYLLILYNRKKGEERGQLAVYEKSTIL